ncbi:Eco57I restriction-modification methylase domain-containing protein [Streptomyces sp. CMB-StM0423]|uniref:Eco57I restriction-modification methylase domain-containing protein n=1 Tax=Streptomyces sp. CMB-StM0423 TaxID=2059884 RepID=UPI000C70071C|nr:DNA methyltransferase [Streptomyces sp. CMB-StM0423]AUH42132.1 restriction endonuclease [Streptomyces sp. CMB-StM0423]
MSVTTRNQVFSAVHTVGGLLPADMLVRISESKEGKDVPGTGPADYHVIGPRRSVRDEAERHWDYLKGVWRELREKLPVSAEADLPADPTGHAIGQWLEPLFNELGFGRLTTVAPGEYRADGDPDRVFPLSHRWHHVPVHMAAWNAVLDKRPGGVGTVPPHSLVQECLNRREAHLWGVLTNGRQLRLLRDSNALATASYVEFDLEAIFDGELFSEFVLLYRLLHVSRFETGEAGARSACWLEKWRTEAIASGTRALDHHRDGVQRALTTLGTGFLRHPGNTALRENLDVDRFHAALLRLAYRMIFLFVAEDRDALLDPGASEETRKRYATYFSSGRLRRLALRRQGTAHADQYAALRIVLDALGREDGRPELGLPGLGGLFDDTAADAPLRDCALSNASLLEAVRHLSRVRDEKTARWRPVDYRNMGSEELGSIYESLLELVPKHSATERTFELVNRLGNDRKKTGSYYTPASLIETLLDSTLDPVIDDAQKRGEQAAAAAGDPDASEAVVGELLSLTVCDPACGSGHFLVAAARRIAKRVAAVRESNPEPTPVAVRSALHEVVARCVYGVDLNPMAVELAKVSLWLEALEPGKALGFLDAHIKHGNGLVGATPALMLDGIPNKAFKAVEGDDAKHAKALEKQNDGERRGQSVLFEVVAEPKVSNTVFGSGLRRITEAPSEKLREVHAQQAAYEDWRQQTEYVHARHLADAWCAAFMWRKAKDAPPPVTHEVFRALGDPEGNSASAATHEEIDRLRDLYRFFHWQLEFPEVFTVPEGAGTGAGAGAGVDPATGWSGGFSCVVGNPPWDKVDFEDKKYFSVVEPSIAAIAGTARRTRIAEWEAENERAGNPEAGKRYRQARRMVKSTFLFASGSGVFPLCAKGLTVKGVTMLQYDQLFAERFAAIAAPRSRFGCIIPTAIATGAGAQHLFNDFTQRGAVAALYDFENRKPLFVGVHASYKFCLLSLAGRELREPAARFAFFLEDPANLDDAERVFALSPEEIARINPNTGTLPIFRTRRDADLTLAIYRRIPVLLNEARVDGNPWKMDFKATFFHTTDDSDLFRNQETLEKEGWKLYGNVFLKDGKRMLPLYEAKMVDFFNHRAADVVKSVTAVSRQNQPRYLSEGELRDGRRLAVPLNWISEDGFIATRRRGRDVDIPGVSLRLRELNWERSWLCGWCDVTASTNERTAVPAFIPRTAVVETYPLMLPRVEPILVGTLIAAQSSLVFDYVSRQKTSNSHLKLFVWKQLPVPTPRLMEPHALFITPRILELVYTAFDMASLACDLGEIGTPFCWDEIRRAQIRAELDAYFFHLYGISHDGADYILESFQTETGGLKNNEIAKYGHYRTKTLVLAEYDRMAAAGVSLTTPLVDGEKYTSSLYPPPGHGPRHPAEPETS